MGDGEKRGCQKGEEHKKDVSDGIEREMRRQREEEEQSRRGYDDMHLAPPHRSSSHVVHRKVQGCKVGGVN